MGVNVRMSMFLCCVPIPNPKALLQIRLLFSECLGTSQCGRDGGVCILLFWCACWDKPMIGFVVGIVCVCVCACVRCWCLLLSLFCRWILILTAGKSQSHNALGAGPKWMSGREPIRAQMLKRIRNILQLSLTAHQSECVVVLSIHLQFILCIKRTHNKDKHW